MRGYLALVGVVAFFCACGGMLILQKIMPKNEDSIGTFLHVFCSRHVPSAVPDFSSRDI